MAEDSSRKRLREESTCSICLEFFKDPVTLDCGHNFCQACIAQCWGEAPTDAPCPQCREMVQAKRLRLNRQLASMVELVKNLDEPPKQVEAGGQVCGTHQESLKLFCQEDQAPICVVCDRSKEHRAHSVVPVEEAAQEFKDQISQSLEILRKERANILLYKAENEKENQDLLKQTKAEREKTAAAFRQLRQFLEEKEKLLLAQTEEVEKEIEHRTKEHLAGLSVELSSLDGLIQELEEKQQQSGSELLQNIGNILKRCKKESFKNPVAFPVALKWKIHDVCDISPFLEGIMKKFKDNLAYELQLCKANVTLDPDTAHPKLILSEDRKSVRWGPRRQTLPNNPWRFDKLPIVLGYEGFTKGRYFWEVAVGSEEEWMVGVAIKSVRRKGRLDISPEEGIWALGKEGGEYWALEDDDVNLSLSGELQRILVILNCVGRRVGFFDADSGAQLYTYSGVSFPGKTLLPFFYLTGGAYLKLSS